MQMLMSDSMTQPHSTVTDWPLASEYRNVVDRPYGTAMMAKLRPSTDSIDSERGSSAL